MICQYSLESIKSLHPGIFHSSHCAIQPAPAALKLCHHVTDGTVLDFQRHQQNINSTLYFQRFHEFFPNWHASASLLHKNLQQFNQNYFNQLIFIWQKY
jgi:hypothetical protein